MLQETNVPARERLPKDDQFRNIFNQKYNIMVSLMWAGSLFLATSFGGIKLYY